MRQSGSDTVNSTNQACRNGLKARLRIRRHGECGYGHVHAVDRHRQGPNISDGHIAGQVDAGLGEVNRSPIGPNGGGSAGDEPGGLDLLGHTMGRYAIDVDSGKIEPTVLARANQRRICRRIVLLDVFDPQRTAVKFEVEPVGLFIDLDLQFPHHVVQTVAVLRSITVIAVSQSERPDIAGLDLAVKLQFGHGIVC